MAKKWPGLASKTHSRAAADQGAAEEEIEAHQRNRKTDLDGVTWTLCAPHSHQGGLPITMGALLYSTGP